MTPRPPEVSATQDRQNGRVAFAGYRGRGYVLRNFEKFVGWDVMQGSGSLSIGTCVAAAFWLLIGCSEASGQPVASCPATAPLRNQLPRGATLLGSTPAGTALFFSSVTGEGPDAVKAHGPMQGQVEGDSEDVGGIRRTRTWFDTADGPHTLVCQYGRSLYPNQGTAMLLVPLPARTSGECIATSDLRNRKGSSRRGMTTVCSRARDRDREEASGRGG